MIHRVAIYLDVESDGTVEDVLLALDTMLDNGCPQDDLNEHEYEDLPAMHVKDAIARPTPDRDPIAGMIEREIEHEEP